MKFPSECLRSRAGRQKDCLGPQSSDTARRQVRIKCLATVCVAKTFVLFFLISIDTKNGFHQSSIHWDFTMLRSTGCKQRVKYAVLGDCVWVQLHWSRGCSPCLHPLQVVQEVLQVLEDPQVPEYRLFQLVLEVLSLPVVVIDRKASLNPHPLINTSMCTQ